MLRSLSLTFVVLLLACVQESNEVPIDQLRKHAIGTASQREVDKATDRFEVEGIPYAITTETEEFGTLHYIHWRERDDERAREILCELIPIPPPGDASYAAEDWAMNELNDVLVERGVATKWTMYADVRFLVWGRGDTPRVRQIYLESFGEELKLFPDVSEQVKELRGCD